MKNGKKILIPFYWDSKWKALYSDKDMTKPVRTKFFTDEQTKEFLKQTGEDEKQQKLK